MQLKKIQTRIFCGQKPKVFIKIKYPEQVAEPESCVTVRIFLFGAVSSKKRYLPTAPFILPVCLHFSSVLWFFSKPELYICFPFPCQITNSTDSLIQKLLLGGFSQK